MKYVLALLAVCVLAAPSMAGEVSQQTLNAVGLAGMEVISDAEGMQIRGLSSRAAAMGTSLVFGQLIDSATGSFAVASDSSAAVAKSSNPGLQVLSLAHSMQHSGINFSLMVVTPTSSYAGAIMGTAGGSATASAF